MSENQNSSQSTIKSKQYKLRPEYRRIPIYLIAGFICLILMIESFSVGRPRPPENHLFGLKLASIIWLLPSLIFLMVTLRWRVRIDDIGLTRRRLFGWHQWSWDEFRRGRVRRGDYYTTYVFPDHPFGQRTLELIYLTADDAEEIMEMCSRFWCPPTFQESEFPDSLAIRLRRIWITYRSYEFKPEGIDSKDRHGSRFHNWKDVLSLRVVRLTHEHEVFWELTLELPNHKLDLVAHQQANDQLTRNWSGPDGQTIIRYLKTHVPADRINEIALHGRPRSLDEIEQRLRIFEKLEKKNLKHIFIFLVAISIIYSVILVQVSLLDNEASLLIGAIIFLILMALHFVILWLMTREAQARLQRQERKLSQWREVLESQR